MTEPSKGSSDPQITIKEVVFLTPAKIKAIVNGEETTIIANVDIINRKVYLNDGDSSISDIVFSHLDEINTLPEDFFSAPDHVTEEAMKVEEERENIYKTAVGVENE